MSDKKRKSFSDINKKYSFLDDGVDGLKDRNTTRDEEARKRTRENSSQKSRNTNNQNNRRNSQNRERREDYRDNTIKMDANAIRNEKRRLEMKARREREQKRKKKRIIAIGVTVALIALVTITVLALLNKSNDKKEDPTAITDESGKTVKDNTDLKVLKSFGITSNATKMYKDSKTSSTELEEIPAGEYLEVYGKVEDFTKIKYNGLEGYIKTGDLSEIEEKNELKVINGVLIVNNTYTLPEGYKTGQNVEAKTQFDLMKSKAKEDGITISIASDYRSYTQQKEKAYNNEGISHFGEYRQDGSQVTAGTSEHQTGLAFDVYGEDYDNKYNKNFATSKEYDWLQSNAHKFGFIIRYQKDKEDVTGRRFEPWHLRFVGTEIAQEMYNNNQSLEEYLGLASVKKDSDEATGESNNENQENKTNTGNDANKSNTNKEKDNLNSNDTDNEKTETKSNDDSNNENKKDNGQ